MTDEQKPIGDQNMAKTRIKAKKDFKVGPFGTIAIKEGQEREVELNANGLFWTHTDDGHFFGYCNVNDGCWEVL